MILLFLLQQLTNGLPIVDHEYRLVINYNYKVSMSKDIFNFMFLFVLLFVNLELIL